MYLSLFLIIVIALLTWLFFLCIKTGLIDKKKSCWLLALGIIGGFILYGMHGSYPKTVIPAIIVVSLIWYIFTVLKA